MCIDVVYHLYTWGRQDVDASALWSVTVCVCHMNIVCVSCYMNTMCHFFFTYMRTMCHFLCVSCVLSPCVYVFCDDNIHIRDKHIHFFFYVYAYYMSLSVRVVTNTYTRRVYMCLSRM